MMPAERCQITALYKRGPSGLRFFLCGRPILNMTAQHSKNRHPIFSSRDFEMEYQQVTKKGGKASLPPNITD